MHIWAAESLVWGGVWGFLWAVCPNSSVQCVPLSPPVFFALFPSRISSVWGMFISLCDDVEGREVRMTTAPAVPSTAPGRAPPFVDDLREQHPGTPGGGRSNRGIEVNPPPQPPGGSSVWLKVPGGGGAISVWGGK